MSEQLAESGDASDRGIKLILFLIVVVLLVSVGRAAAQRARGRTPETPVEAS